MAPWRCHLQKRTSSGELTCAICFFLFSAFLCFLLFCFLCITTSLVAKETTASGRRHDTAHNLCFAAAQTDLTFLHKLTCDHIMCSTSCCMLYKPCSSSSSSSTGQWHWLLLGHCSSMDRHHASAHPKLNNRCFACYRDAQIRLLWSTKTALHTTSSS